MTEISNRITSDALATLDVPKAPALCPACSRFRGIQLFCKSGYDIFSCIDCGFLFIHPYPDDAALARHYALTYRGASADFYPKALDRRWRGFWRSLLFMRYVQNKDVLDLGCGGGFMVEAFARLGAHAVGIDISRNSIDYAEKRFPRHKFYCEPLSTFRKRGLAFDFVFSSEVLEHVPGPAEFMETVASVIKPNGYVYISAPDAGHDAVPADLTKWGDICPPEHLQW